MSEITRGEAKGLVEAATRLLKRTQVLSEVRMLLSLSDEEMLQLEERAEELGILVLGRYDV